jgi:hypothetical protein
MRRIAGAFFVSFALSTPAIAGDATLQRCATTADAAQRLHCFDTLARERAKEPPAIGKIEICRDPRVQGMHQEDAIDIPASASVVNWGEKSSLVAGSIGEVVIATIEAVTLKHGEKCVQAQAQVKENPKQRPVIASPDVQYLAQGDAKSPWATVASYRITVASDFK